jgi:hypothetical protein
MDWGAALGGLDQELAQIMARNKLQNDTQLGLVKTVQDIHNTDRNQTRLEAQQKAQENYWNQMSDARSREVDAKAAAADKVLQDKAETDALIEQYNATQEPALRAAISARLRARKVALPQEHAVYTLQGDKLSQLNTPAGVNARVISKPALPDDETLGPIAEAVRAGDKDAIAYVRRNPDAQARVLELAFGKGSGVGTDYSLAGQHASFAAKKAALASSEKAMNIIEGYSKVWTLNADNYEKSVAALPDTGIPYLNKPIREIDEKLLGSPVITAAKSYAIPTLREYVRLTGSSPNMTGPIHQTAIDEATIEQINTAISAMRMDIQNAHVGLGEQKSQLESEIEVMGKIRGEDGKEIAKADAAKHEEAAAEDVWTHEEMQRYADQKFHGDTAAALAKLKESGITVKP